MNILDALSYGTSLGLGSPQQQRDNVFRQSELDQRKMLAQQELDTRKRAEEDTKKRFEMQYGNATPDEMLVFRAPLEEAGYTLPGNAAISRPMLQHLMTLANQVSLKEPNLIVDPTNYNIVGETAGRKAPMLPSVQGEYEAPNPDVQAGENPEPSGRQTRAPQEARQGLVMRPGSVAAMLGRRREEETEKRNAETTSRTAMLAAEKLKQIQAAREEYQRKVPIEQILAKFPQVTAKDVYGYEPASPSSAKPTTQLGVDEEGNAYQITAGEQGPSVAKGGKVGLTASQAEAKRRENERNADRDEARGNALVNQIDTRYNGYTAQYGPMGAFSMPPAAGARPPAPMTKGEYIALTEPANRYEKYFGKKAPDLKKIKSTRILSLVKSMYPNEDLSALKTKAAAGDKSATQRIETIFGQADTVLKREIAEVPEE